MIARPLADALPRRQVPVVLYGLVRLESINENLHNTIIFVRNSIVQWSVPRIILSVYVCILVIGKCIDNLVIACLCCHVDECVAVPVTRLNVVNDV